MKRYTTENRHNIGTVIIVVSILAPFLVILDFSSVGGKNILLYSRAVQCGKWPVEAVQHITFGAGGLEYVPARPFMPTRFGDLSAYCNRRETSCMEFKDNVDLSRNCEDVYEKYNVEPRFINGLLNSRWTEDD